MARENFKAATLPVWRDWLMQVLSSILTRQCNYVAFFKTHLWPGLPDWPFLGQISEIWPRFKLVGLKFYLAFMASSQVGWPESFFLALQWICLFATRNCFLYVLVSLTQRVVASRKFTCSSSTVLLACRLYWPQFRHSKFGLTTWTPRLFSRVLYR